MNDFNYPQSFALDQSGSLLFMPYAHYWSDAGSTLDEFAIDVQGTHPWLMSDEQVRALWACVLVAKCETQARWDTGVSHGNTWRDHRLRLIRAHVYAHW